MLEAGILLKNNLIHWLLLYPSKCTFEKNYGTNKIGRALELRSEEKKGRGKRDKMETKNRETKEFLSPPPLTEFFFSFL